MSNVQPLLSLGDRRVGSLGSDMPCTEYCVTLGRVLPETSSDLYVMGSETGGHVSLRAEARARSNGNWKIGDGEGTIVAGLTEHGWAAVEEVYRNGNRRAYLPTKHHDSWLVARRNVVAGGRRMAAGVGGRAGGRRKPGMHRFSDT